MNSKFFHRTLFNDYSIYSRLFSSYYIKYSSKYFSTSSKKLDESNDVDKTLLINQGKKELSVEEKQYLSIN